MTTKRWRLVVNPLSGATPLHQLEVEASNWMGALRAARQELGEDGGVPAGASCAVAPDGTVTILDSASRRKFLLVPTTSSLPPQSLPPDNEGAAGSAPPPAATAPATPMAAPVAVPTAAPTAPAEIAPEPAAAKKRKFQTVAYTPGMDVPGMPAAAPAAAAAQQPVAVAPAPVRVAAPAVAVSAPVAPVAQPAVAVASAAPINQDPPKKKKFETVAFSSDQARAVMSTINVGGEAAAAPAAAAAAPAVTPAIASPVQPAAAPAPQRAVSQPMPEPRAPSQPLQPSAASSPRNSAVPLALELLFMRDEDPGANNPLTYRERAYVIPRGMTVTDAEAALRFTLADLQGQIQDAARGKLVNLAAFDHRWTEAPQRPPLVVLEWRDWRGEPAVDYPAAERPSSPGGDDERLALVFEELHELPHLRTALEGLEFVIQLLARTVPAAAATACLYDINTDELRFVAVTGPGADTLRGTAISRNTGLLGQACRIEGRPLVIANVLDQPSYNAASDGRSGLDVLNMLLRAVVREGHLLGLLQLVNRRGADFSTDDVHVVNYIADRLAEFLHVVRVRPS